MYILIVLLAWLGIFMVTFEVVMTQGKEYERLRWICIFIIMTVFVFYTMLNPSVGATS